RGDFSYAARAGWMNKERRSLVRRLKKGGLETAPPWNYSVSEIFEMCCDTKVAAADKLNDCLQLVFLFSSNANLLVLQLALYLEPLRLNRLNNFLRLVPFEALLNL